MQRLGLQRKLLAGFLAVTLVTFISCGIALYLFSELSNAVESMAHEQVPDIRTAESISHKSQRLQTHITRLRTLASDTERPSAIGQLRDQWRSLRSRINSFSRTRLADLTAEPFNDELARIEALVAETNLLDELTTRRLAFTAKRKRIQQQVLQCQENYNRFIRPRIERLDKQLRESIEQLAQGAEPSAVIAAMTQAVDRHETVRALSQQASDLTTLLLTAADSNEIIDLNRRARTAIQLRRIIRTRSDQAPNEVHTFTQSWLTRMSPYLSGPDALVPARRQEIRLQSIVQAHLNKHTQLAEQISEKAEQQVLVGQEHIDHFAAKSKVKIQLYNVLLVMAALVFLACILLIFWLYVGKGIINPLIDTSRAMLAISKGEADTPLPQASSDEIGDMLRALERLKGYVVQVQSLAQTDGLTGLYNRRQFDITLEKELRRAQREGSPLTLILFDIDHFKAYNDRYGHVAGDSCLKRIAATIKQQCQRASDLCARYGGEEFAIVLPTTDAKGAQQMGEQLRQAIADLDIPHSTSPVAHHVTVSIGMVTIQSHITTDKQTLNSERVIQLADERLYEAKQTGRDQVKWMGIP